MATVRTYTKTKLDQIVNDTVIDGSINGSGHLILEQFDGSTIDAGSVIGPTGPMGSNDPGDIVASIRTSKTGFLHMNGQSIPNANTAHPDLWAQVPASWKSGTTLNLPDMTDTILQGGAVGTIGDAVGSNTKVLVEANLPPHTHTGPSHTHIGGAHTHGMAHTHTMAHTHEHVHTHADSFGTSVDVDSATRSSSTPGTTNSFMTASATGTSEVLDVNPIVTVSITGAVGAASDATTGGSSAANTGGSSAASTGSGGGVATSASGTDPTGPGAGTSSPVNVQQKAFKVNYFIKT